MLYIFRCLQYIYILSKHKVFHDYSEVEYTTSGRCVFSTTVNEVSPPARNFIVSRLIGNLVSSSPLFLSPGSSLHHPVQRRQRRGGVHVGVPLPGGEASPAGPLTACQPGAASPQYYPCEVFLPSSCSDAEEIAYPETHRDLAGPLLPFPARTFLGDSR